MHVELLFSFSISFEIFNIKTCVGFVLVGSKYNNTTWIISDHTYLRNHWKKSSLIPRYSVSMFIGISSIYQCDLHVIVTICFYTIFKEDETR